MNLLQSLSHTFQLDVPHSRLFIEGELVELEGKPLYIVHPSHYAMIEKWLTAQQFVKADNYINRYECGNYIAIINSYGDKGNYLSFTMK